jgi:hypothetical protein
MKKTRRTRTTVETRELIIIRGARQLTKTLCPECSEAIALVTLNEAVHISGLSSRAVYRLIEAGRIHFTERTDGTALICPATLLRQAWKAMDG